MYTLRSMTQISRNIALMFLGVVAVSTVGAFALLQPSQESVKISETSGMMMGHVVLTVVDENGNVKAYRQTDNLITNTGIASLAGLFFEDIAGATAGEASHIIVGTGGETAAAYTSTGSDLITAITGGACARQDAAFTVQTAAANGDTTIRGTASFTGSSCDDASIDEAVLYNDLTAGEALARTVFTAVTTTASDTLNITWDYTLAN